GPQGNDTVVKTPDQGKGALDFSEFEGPVQVDLRQSGPQVVSPGLLTLTLSSPSGVTDVLGSPFDDTIFGNAADNVLRGGAGQDLLVGFAGNDTLQGGFTQVVYLDFDSLTIPGQHVYTQDERDTIQAHMQANYADFSFTFTQQRPQTGPYTTLTFNDPTLVG